MQASIHFSHFMGRAVEETVASLFNMGRVSCHSVVLSYFVRLGGMQVRSQHPLCLMLMSCGWNCRPASSLLPHADDRQVGTQDLPENCATPYMCEASLIAHRTRKACGD